MLYTVYMPHQRTGRTQVHYWIDGRSKSAIDKAAYDLRLTQTEVVNRVLESSPLLKEYASEKPSQDADHRG